VRLKSDGTRAETGFLLSPKRTSPFKSAGASVQSTAGSRVMRISVNNAGYTTFRGNMRVLTTHSILQFPLHFPSLASPCAIKFQTQSNIRTQSSVLSCKSKSLLVKCHAGTEVQNCSCTLFNAISSWSYVVIATPRRFYPQEIAPLPIVEKAGLDQRRSARVWETEDLFHQRSSTPKLSCS